MIKIIFIKKKNSNNFHSKMFQELTIFKYLLQAFVT